MTQVMPMAAQIVSGPPLFATIYDIRVIPTATTFTVTFRTDQSCQCAVIWTAQSDAPSIGGGPLSGTVNDAAAALQHSVVVTPTQGAGGKTYTFQIVLAATDVSGLTLRPREGFAQLTGARAAQQLPVRFYAMGGTPPAPAGGTGGQGGGTGNWSQYTWAQYNPKRTTYPTP